MMDSLENIINCRFLNSDDILIFDSYRTAREYLKRFVCKHPDEVISSNRAIGLAELKQIIKQSSDNKPASLLDKYHFLYDFCHARVNEDYIRKLTGRTVDYKYLINLLSSLKGITPLENFYIKDESLKNALIHLRDSYSEYLRMNGLSDETYDEFKELSLEERYVLVAPESSLGMRKFLAEAGEKNLEAIGLPSNDNHFVIEFFPNERIEIRQVLKDIVNKLEKKPAYESKDEIKGEDIIITVADLKRIQKHIEKEANDIGLKLIFNQSIPFCMTSSGMLLTGLIEFIRSKSWYSIQHLSLLPSIGETARKRLRQISMMMIDISANDIQSFIEKLNGYKNKQNQEGIRNDADFLKALISEDSLGRIWQNFIDYFQVSFDEEAEGKKEAEDIIECADSYMQEDYQIILALINSMTCKGAAVGEGIKVFEYGTDILYPAKIRYIIGLSDQTMTSRYTDYDFLSDYHKDGDGFAIDTSEPLLRSYAETSSELKISGSSICFGAVHSVPMFFYDEKANIILKKKEEKSRVYKFEKLKEERGVGPETLWKDVAFCDGNTGFISGSNIDNAEKCLLRVKLENQNGLKFSRFRWNPSDKDAALEGRIMHLAINKYIETYYKSNRRYDMNLFSSILEVKCIHAGYTKHDAAFFMRKYGEGINGLFDLISELEAESISSEKHLGSGNKPILKDSIADLIIETIDGHKVIIDIKTGRAEKYKKSKQLILYSLLDEQDKDDSKQNRFFSIRDNEQVKSKETAVDFDAIETNVKNRNWVTSLKEDGCEYCQFYGICRRGYFA